jgi:hypothetical protein
LRDREPDPLKPLWGVEQCDLLERDVPAPAITGPCGTEAMLPTTVRWVCGLVQRIGVVGDVAIEAGVNDAGVHVEPGH